MARKQDNASSDALKAEVMRTLAEDRDLLKTIIGMSSVRNPRKQ